MTLSVQHYSVDLLARRGRIDLWGRRHIRHNPRCQAAAVSIRGFLIMPRSFAATPGPFLACWAACQLVSPTTWTAEALSPFGFDLSKHHRLLARIFVGIFRFQQRLCCQCAGSVGADPVLFDL